MRCLLKIWIINLIFISCVYAGLCYLVLVLLVHLWWVWGLWCFRLEAEMCELFTSFSLWPPQNSQRQSKPPGRWWWDTLGCTLSSDQTSSHRLCQTEHAGEKHRLHHLVNNQVHFLIIWIKRMLERQTICHKLMQTRTSPGFLLVL